MYFLLYLALLLNMMFLKFMSVSIMHQNCRPFSWMSNIPCVFIYLCVNKHLTCFHISAIMNGAAVNAGV